MKCQEKIENGQHRTLKSYLTTSYLLEGASARQAWDRGSVFM